MSVDAISLEVFRNLVVSVAEEMGVVLRRSAFSPNIRERLDFSCAIFDADARMVAQAAHIPVHLGSIPASVQAAYHTVADLSPGDVIVLNDPYHGGTHLPDITMVSPVFDDGRLAFFVASRAHHADVGGMSPGSLPLSLELYQEGLIIPPVKLIDGGVRNEALFTLMKANTRAPGEREGDFQAQLAANFVGVQRLQKLIAQRGVSDLHEHAASLQNYARRMTESVIQAIPDGTYSAVDYLEGDGQNEFDILLNVTITVNGNRMSVDFAGSAGQVQGNVNAVPAIVRSATWYCVRLLSDEDVPVNQGCFDPIDVLLPKHSVVNPDFPSAVAVGNTETAQRVVDVVLKALAQAMPGRIPAASQGTMNNLTVGGAGQRGAFVYYETIGGGHGASMMGDGLSGRQSHMTNTLNTPVEALENELPLRVWRYQLREDSGGDGANRGGNGIVREYEFLTEATIVLNCERRRHSPYGILGGEPGAVGQNLLHFVDRDVQAISGKSQLRASVGDRLIMLTPGGGGAGQQTNGRDS